MELSPTQGGTMKYDGPRPTDPDPATDDLLAESLIEEISIDGMCGVY
jgi:mycofactocin precursor